MSGRHQPLNGADSAEALLRRLVAVVDTAGMLWTDPVPADSIAAIHDAKEFLARTSPQCAACSLPAVTDGYCAGHARLFEYTDHERSGGIAANE